MNVDTQVKKSLNLSEDWAPILYVPPSRGRGQALETAGGGTRGIARKEGLSVAVVAPPIVVAPPVVVAPSPEDFVTRAARTALPTPEPGCSRTPSDAGWPSTMVVRQGLRGVGDTRWCFLITTFSSYAIRLPAAGEPGRERRADGRALRLRGLDCISDSLGLIGRVEIILARTSRSSCVRLS